MERDALRCVLLTQWRTREVFDPRGVRLASEEHVPVARCVELVAPLEIQAWSPRKLLRVLRYAQIVGDPERHVLGRSGGRLCTDAGDCPRE
jgi:hypothetical protein